MMSNKKQESLKKMLMEKKLEIWNNVNEAIVNIFMKRYASADR